MFLLSRIIVLLALCLVCNGWIILNGTYFTCPRIVYPRSQQNVDVVEGLVVYDNSSNIAGNIVVSHRAYSRGARDLQNQGAIGVIFMEFAIVPGLAMFAVDGDEADMTVPICQTFQTNIDQFMGHVVIMDVTEANEWQIMNNSPISIVYQAVVSAFCLTNIILAIHRSVLFVRAFGPIIGFAQVCLACEIIANTIRLVYAAVDPAFMRQIYPFTVSYVMLTLSFPFTFAALLLITFYWHELISKTSLKINRFLGRSRIGFFIVIGLLFAAEIVTGPFRTVETDINATIFAIGVIYGCIVLAIALFYWFTGGKVIAYLSKRSRASSDTALVMLRRTTTRVVVSGVLLTCFIGSMAFLTFPQFKQPAAIMTIWFLAYMFLSGTSLLQILSFYPRLVAAAASSSTNLHRTSSYHQRQQSLNSRRGGSSVHDTGMSSKADESAKIESFVESRSSSHSTSESEDGDEPLVSVSSNRPLATKSASEAVLDKTNESNDVKIVEDTSASSSEEQSSSSESASQSDSQSGSD